jgi:uncharacterized membrane protein YkvA (DUF1232 family)
LAERASQQSRLARLQEDVYALYLAYQDRGTPWYAKGILLAVVAYALSPIDLIPDFIPVLGYLDDLIIVPAGVRLALRLVPSDVLAECRTRARSEFADKKPKAARTAAFVIVTMWVIFLVWIIRLAVGFLRR